MTDLHDNDRDKAFALELQDAYAADPTPQHGADFWQSLRDDLAFDAGPVSGGDEYTAHDVPVTSADPSQGRSSWRFVVGAVAACLVFVLGGFLVTRDNGRDRTATVADAPGGSVDEDRPRLVFSPLTTLSEDIASTELEPLFSVRSNSGYGVYNRLATLDQLAGNGAWSSSSDYTDADEIDPPDGTSSLAEYTIIGGDSPWLPVPPGTFHVERPLDVALSTSPDDETWILDDRSQIERYSAFYNTPTIALAEMWVQDVQSRPEVTYELDPQHVQLPDDFSPTATALAASVTRDAESDLDRAVFLELYFRAQFSYDPDVDLVGSGGTGSSAVIDRFLETRAGHAEHFAGVYAAMLRSLGVPARVAVGYLPGQVVDGDPTLRLVRQSDAHAWAEVNFGGVWLPFDPTPTRGSSATGSSDRPAANQDHWHAPYAIYDCRTGGYLEPFDSVDDPVGIHSHQDGLIHIHPFFESSAGDNATFALFLDAMGATLDQSGLNSSVGALPATATCDGQDAVLHLRKWQFDFVTDSTDPQIVVDGIGSVRFENDREVYLLALAPVDGDLPPFPAERLDMLDTLTGATTSSGPLLAPGDAPLPGVDVQEVDAQEVEVPSGG